MAVMWMGYPKTTVLKATDSYGPVLRRASTPDRGNGTTTAEEIVRDDRLLREVVAQNTGVPRQGPSAIFSPSRSTFGVDLLVAHTDIWTGRCARS